jgi:hypothetical protein
MKKAASTAKPASNPSPAASADKQITHVKDGSFDHKKGIASYFEKGQLTRQTSSVMPDEDAAAGAVVLADRLLMKEALDQPFHTVFSYQHDPQQTRWAMHSECVSGVSTVFMNGPMLLYSGTDTSTQFIASTLIHGVICGEGFSKEVDQNQATYYMGGFLDGKRHGSGTELTLMNKTSQDPAENPEHVLLSGFWQHGLEHGQFKWFFKHRTRIGRYHEGKMIGVTKTVWNDQSIDYCQAIGNEIKSNSWLFSIDPDGTFQTSINGNTVEIAAFLVDLYQQHLTEFLLIVVKKLSFDQLNTCCETLVASNHLWAPMVCFTNTAKLPKPSSVLPCLETVDESRLFVLLKDVLAAFKQDPLLLRPIDGMMQVCSQRLSEQSILSDLVKVFPGVEYLQPKTPKETGTAIKQYKNAVKETFLSLTLQRIELILARIGNETDYKVIHKKMKQLRGDLEKLNGDRALKQWQEDRQQQVTSLEKEEQNVREEITTAYFTDMDEFQAAKHLLLKPHASLKKLQSDEPTARKEITLEYSKWVTLAQEEKKGLLEQHKLGLRQEKKVKQQLEKVQKDDRQKVISLEQKTRQEVNVEHEAWIQSASLRFFSERPVTHQERITSQVAAVSLKAIEAECLFNRILRLTSGKKRDKELFPKALFDELYLRKVICALVIQLCKAKDSTLFSKVELKEHQVFLKQAQTEIEDAENKLIAKADKSWWSEFELSAEACLNEITPPASAKAGM